MMSIQVLYGNDDLMMLYIRLDMCDTSAIPKAKKVINACNRAIKKKDCTENTKREILTFRDDLIKKVKELEDYDDLPRSLPFRCYR